MWSVGTSFAIFFLTVVQGVILARLLGPEGRGEYGTAVFYTQTLTYIGLLGTQLSIARRAAKGADQIEQLGRASLRLGMLTGLATMLVASILAVVALPAEGLPGPAVHRRRAVLAFGTNAAVDPGG